MATNWAERGNTRCGVSSKVAITNVNETLAVYRTRETNWAGREKLCTHDVGWPARQDQHMDNQSFPDKLHRLAYRLPLPRYSVWE
jgi:hypothetical protein